MAMATPAASQRTLVLLSRPRPRIAPSQAQARRLGSSPTTSMAFAASSQNRMSKLFME